MAKKREFIVRWRLTFAGADFFVLAKNSQEAIEMVKAGEWHTVETKGAEVIDWEVQNSAEENV